ncbi:MAG: glycine C-acetyltransferase [Candidatus Neomarinimicrobiota bacterium]|nr:MAG: glycine C-acetyltransferase [bacterium]
MIKDQNIFVNDLAKIKAEGLYKDERTITTPQGVLINTVESGDALNFCSNNYLGLSNQNEIKEAAKDAVDKYGFGMSSVRFICGTQQIHKKLERKISEFFGTDDSILYTSCFDANGGLFETILGPDDAIISDELNHASIIDGIRLCKANRFRFKNNDMGDLELKLRERDKFGTVMIATDGVFSMDGHIAKIDKITELAQKYNAMVMVDDSHATGFIGKTGRGSAEYCGVMDKVDIWTSTFGKALGGASGGFTTGKQEIIDLLRQRSRPYLFSNTLAPSIVAASIKAIDIISLSTDLRDKLEQNTNYFRKEMTDAGFDIKMGSHPIVPIMIYDAILAKQMAELLLDKGIYVVGFFYPVVPKNMARIRVQISAEMEIDQLSDAISIFSEVGQKLKILK